MSVLAVGICHRDLGYGELGRAGLVLMAIPFSIRRMTNGGTPDAGDQSNYQRVKPLTLTTGGVREAISSLIMPGAAALITAVLLGAVVSGEALWLTIPLMIIFAIVSLSLLPAARRDASRRGVTIDEAGVHTTLRGEESSFIPWREIEAAGISYRIVTNASGNRSFPYFYGLDLFCSAPREDGTLKQGQLGMPLRADFPTTPSYGIPEGHVRIGIPSADAPKRQEVLKFMADIGNIPIVGEFERPKMSSRME